MSMPFLAARIQVEKCVTIRNSSARKCIVRVCSRVLIATETGLRVKPLNKYKYLINKIFVLVIYPYVTPGKIRVTRVGQERQTTCQYGRDTIWYCNADCCEGE